MRLPDSSGLSVLQRLKDDPRTRHIPVHVVSAQDRGGDGAAPGRDRLCAQADHARAAARRCSARSRTSSTQKVKRVLLVEDDARQRDSVVQLIGDDDVEIAAVGSGAGGAGRCCARRVFDCMIIDLKLPDMQGSELLRAHGRRRRSCSFPPVIVYTGRNLTRDEEAELLRYSRSIIIKGARSPERLLDEVTLFLHKVEIAAVDRAPDACCKTARGRDKVFEGRTHPAGGRRRAQHLRADQRAGAARAPTVRDRPQRLRGAGQARRRCPTSTWC